MTNKEIIQKLSEIAKAAHANCIKLEGIRAAFDVGYDGLPIPCQLGDVFMFKGMPDDCPLMFAITTAHPDNEGDRYNPKPNDLFLMLPVDHYLSVHYGLHDVLEENNLFLGDILAFGGYSFWIDRESIDLSLRIGWLGLDMLKRCRKMMANMVRGNHIDATPEQWENHDNPDYWEWEDEVDAWINFLTNKVRGT